MDTPAFEVGEIEVFEGGGISVGGVGTVEAAQGRLLLRGEVFDPGDAVSVAGDGRVVEL